MQNLLIALFCYQKDKLNGAPSKEGAGAWQCPTHLSQKANMGEGGEQD